MALNLRSDHAKMWKEFFNFYFIVITSGLLYLILLVTSEPVCYTRVSLDERNGYMKGVDCNDTDKICHRFASREDVKLGVLLNSPCGYPENNPSTHEKEIMCSTNNLPNVGEGSFNCAPNTDVSIGKACNLTCNDGFYPAYSSRAVCEEDITHKGGVWSDGSFVCHECNDWNEWNGTEYKLNSSRHTWEESRQSCESDNSHLVTIGNKEENEFVRRIVWHCGQCFSGWIGLNDLNAEGTWEWSNGTVSTYENWREGEPDGGNEGIDCVFLHGHHGDWNDGWCNYGLHAVCERN